MSTDFTTMPLPCTREAAHETFRKWLGADYDTDTLDALLCAQAAHLLNDGEPLWLLILSGSGNAKTETVQALRGAGAMVESTIASEGALLSGTENKSKAKNATGGLLRRIGDSGTLVIKDVTSILSMHRDTRAMVLAALREIYDGRWTRNLGTDGGKTLEWEGRVTVIGAVTSAWDRAHSVIAAMGDRWVIIRSDSATSAVRLAAGRQAMSNVGHEVDMRKELSDAVAGVLMHVSGAHGEQILVTEDEQERILAIADVVTRTRTAVEYDYQGNAEFAHLPEAPTRFAKQLVQLVRGGLAIGMTRDQAIRLAMRCGRDSMPPNRRRILLDLAAHPDSRPFEVRQRVGLPKQTVRRELDGLLALGVVVADERESETGSFVWYHSVSDDLDTAALLDEPREPDMSVQGHKGNEKKESSTRGVSDTSGSQGPGRTSPDGVGWTDRDPHQNDDAQSDDAGSWRASGEPVRPIPRPRSDPQRDS